MDGEAGWWTTSGNIGLPPLARVMGVGRQQQHKHVCSRDMSDAMMNNACFNTSDQSTLNIIDPDFHYLTVNCCPIDTPYFSEQLFRDKYRNNTNLSMLHLNIRSVPDHFFGLISFLDNLTI